VRAAACSQIAVPAITNPVCCSAWRWGQGRPAGLWLIYLVFAVAQDFILKYTLPG
jgi:hypothetical protein